MRKYQKVICMLVMASLILSGSRPAPEELNFIDCNVVVLITTHLTFS